MTIAVFFLIFLTILIILLSILVYYLSKKHREY